MKSTYHFSVQALCLFTTLLLFACSQEDLEPASTLNNSAVAELKPMGSTEFYALTDQNQLIAYNLSNNLKEQSLIEITGLQSGEMILAIDFRPATGQLYGVSNQSRIYVINQNSGMTTQIGSQPFSPAINGMQVGFDFNPTVDRIRLVTDAEQNLRLHPETGNVVAVDGNLNPGNPSVVAVAYTNSRAGAISTTLYDIDTQNDKLYIQSPPNQGSLVEVGRLNVQAVGEGGFDISSDNSLALAVLYGRGGGAANQPEITSGNKYRFYSIDLTTGKAKNLGKTDYTILGIAIPIN